MSIARVLRLRVTMPLALALASAGAWTALTVTVPAAVHVLLAGPLRDLPDVHMTNVLTAVFLLEVPSKSVAVILSATGGVTT